MFNYLNNIPARQLDAAIALAQLTTGGLTLNYGLANRGLYYIPTKLTKIQPLIEVANAGLDTYQILTANTPEQRIANGIQLGTGLIGTAGRYDLLYKIPWIKQSDKLDKAFDYIGIGNATYDIGEGGYDLYNLNKDYKDYLINSEYLEKSK